MAQTHNTGPTNQAAPPPSKKPWQVFCAFLYLGLTSFGGPMAHIGFFRRTFVEQKRWLTDPQFSQLLALCQFLPGPASSQLGFAIGLKHGGWLGAILAFFAFTLPSALLLLAFALSLTALTHPVADAALHGLKLVAFVVVTDAVWHMSRSLCPDWPRRIMAVVTVIVLVAMGQAWVQLILVAIGAGLGIAMYQQTLPSVLPSHQTVKPSRRSNILSLTALTSVVALFIVFPWLAPDHSVAKVAAPFYQAGALVFGGGHVVLPLLESSMTSAGVPASTFLAGYGASQAVPGPMFAFAAFLGAVMPADLSPIAASAVALGAIFLPGFLLLSAILPWWEQLSAHPLARGAVSGVNAVVVGLLGAALYNPIITTSLLSAADVGIGLVGLVMIMRYKLSALWVVSWCSLASIGSALL